MGKAGRGDSRLVQSMHVDAVRLDGPVRQPGHCCPSLPEGDGGALDQAGVSPFSIGGRGAESIS